MKQAQFSKSAACRIRVHVRNAQRQLEYLRRYRHLEFNHGVHADNLAKHLSAILAAMGIRVTTYGSAEVCAVKLKSCSKN